MCLHVPTTRPSPVSVQPTSGPATRLRGDIPLHATHALVRSEVVEGLEVVPAAEVAHGRFTDAVLHA